MRNLGIFLMILLFDVSAFAQRMIAPTDSLIICGKIQSVRVLTSSDLQFYPTEVISDQVIYNHRGVAKDTLTRMKGVALKTVLDFIKYVYEKPRELNEFYFIFTASDGYKVVFSWNEIYNTETGNHFYIITEMDGKKLNDISERIAFIASSDLKSGRRYIKGLAKIEVKRLE